MNCSFDICRITYLIFLISTEYLKGLCVIISKLRSRMYIFLYYASCIKNNQGYSLNQWAENKLRDESYVNCQFIIASNMTLYTVRKSVCESG